MAYTDSIRGAKFRGSRFPGFTGGGTGADGNLTPAGAAGGASAADGSSAAASPLAASPESALANIYAGTPKPQSALSTGDALEGAATSLGTGAATYAGQQFGSGAGAALANGASVADAAGAGASKLGGAISENVSAAGKYLGFGGEAAAISNGVMPVTAGVDSAMYGAGAVTTEAGASAGSGAAGAAAAEGAPSFSDALFSGSNIGGAVGTGVLTAGLGMAMGQEPVKALDDGLASGVGFALGNAIVPGVGGFVGGALGPTIFKPIFSVFGGGRVICTELVRQGKMDQGLLDLDIAFSMRHIGNVTKVGYWLWAVPVVRWMRRDDWLGRLSTAIAHPLALWRAEQLAYQMGARKRPHIRGVLVRLIGESMCWTVGASAVAACRIKQRLGGKPA